MQLTLGTKIRELRRSSGCTQEALAAALGVTSQAVSRWESAGSYPDMELLPSIANFFDVTIDELFGYSSDRTQKVDQLVSHIAAMTHQNNGADINIGECIALAREALLEFPGNNRLMLCLASALYKAGYVRYGEHHLIDAEGYSVHDVQRHQGYAEWQEAITLYEKSLTSLPSDSLRHDAVDALSQLYLNVGARDKALALAETAPSIWGSREFLQLRAHDGREYAAALGQTLLSTTHTCAALCVQGVLAAGQNLSPAEKVQSLRGALGMFEQICPDDNFGEHHALAGKICMLLSLFLWMDRQRDEAFAALEDTLRHFRLYEALCRKREAVYTAPLVKLAHTDMTSHAAELANGSSIPRLPKDWPWWSVPEAEQVRQEMQADPRWQKWVEKTQA